jgi:hypothetical protein
MVDLDALLEQMLSDVNQTTNNQSILPISDGEMLFCCELSEGYHFRNMFEYLRGPNLDANLIFNKDGLSYSCANGKKTILNHFSVPACNITYYFNNAYESVVAGINLSIFARTTHNIGKKETFRMFMRKGVAVIFYEIVSMLSTGMSTHSSGHINVKEVEISEHRFPNPNGKVVRHSVPVGLFCHTCSILSNMKCNRVRITCYTKGFKFEGIDNYGQVQSIQRFYPPKIKMVENANEKTVSVEVVNNSLDVDVGDIVQVLHINVLTAKWLSKLTNVSTHGDKVQIYCDPEEPWYISGNIGFYGNYSVFLKEDFEK